MAASIVDKRTPKWHDGTAALVAASTAPTDTQLAARVEAKRAEDEWYAGRLVDAYCGGDSLVRAMLGLPLGVAS